MKLFNNAVRKHLANYNDELVKHKILQDDNYTIVKSHDGSRVYYDKSNPRLEIEIDYA